MAYLCAQCGAPVQTMTGAKVARKDECPKCHADLHACQQCSFYDTSSYNECREPSAERVVDKARSNYCDFFQFAQRNSAGKPSVVNAQDAARKKLDDLFKK